MIEELAWANQAQAICVLLLVFVTTTSSDSPLVVGPVSIVETVALDITLILTITGNRSYLSFWLLF